MGVRIKSGTLERGKEKERKAKETEVRRQKTEKEMRMPMYRAGLAALALTYEA